ncbi:MAG: sporulation protein [Candidatus Bathyarchaeota archaeon]|nr:sporulation protein [Candidatus Bathyarchaeota archaeon]
MFFKKFTNKFTAPNATVQLKLGQYSVALGENLEGTLTVSSNEDFDATEVRCEISCVERAVVIRQEYDPQLRRMLPRQVQESSVLFAAKPVLSGPLHLANGETRDFPLSINIPAGGRATLQGMDRSVTWSIKGVVAVDGRPDVTSSVAGLQVVQPSAQPVIKEKEVVRQVVMIPCKYCGMLMDQLVTVCPNCGAKRTG